MVYYLDRQFDKTLNITSDTENLENLSKIAGAYLADVSSKVENDLNSSINQTNTTIIINQNILQAIQ
ncbi:MAG: hypothetical protein PHV37_07930 [Candidatus Gastranaerophilales bacterium]|nr:hypothetical protein [Candidatus Gastranaerophilales bacterium]